MSAMIINHPDVIGGRKTITTTTVAAGLTSFPVENGSVFTQNDFGILNGYGSQVSELLRFSTVTTTTLTSSAASLFGHDGGTTIEVIAYDQAVIEYSTNLSTLWDTGLYATLTDASAAATWTVGSTIALAVSQPTRTYYDDGSTVSRSYRTRFYNSFTTAYSNYSSPVLPTGFEEKSIGAIFRKAASITNKEISSSDSGQINYSFLFDEANQCSRDIGGSRKRWSHDENFNGTIGDVVAGTNKYLLPSNIEERNTKLSVWNVKIDDQHDLQYMDKREYDSLTIGQHTSPTATTLTSASSSVTLTDTSNFDDTGSITVWASGVSMTVTYTANNRTMNVLTTPSTATQVTASVAIGTPAWQGASFGTPHYYTVFNGYMYFDLIPDDTIHNRTIGADYYLKIQQFTVLSDYVRENDPNLFINWLRWAIMIKSNNEQMALMYRQLYDNGLKELKKLEYTGQKQYLRPPKYRYGMKYLYSNKNSNYTTP